MDDYGLVVNAGSSSLKFCVYRRPDVADWRLAARGQIDGIGSAPKLSARDDAGNTLVDKSLADAVRDGRAALDVLAGWLRERFGGAKVLGVGHRVVHGGARHAKPCLVTAEVLEELRALAPEIAEGRVIGAHLGSAEHSAVIRRRIGEASAWLGLELDGAANDAHGPRISRAGIRISAWVIPTNEELMIARHTGALLGIAGRRA